MHSHQKAQAFFASVVIDGEIGSGCSSPLFGGVTGSSSILKTAF